MSDRIRLSMKDVNQYNGREFNKKDSKQYEQLALHSTGGNHGSIGTLTGIKIEIEN